MDRRLGKFELDHNFLFGHSAEVKEIMKNVIILRAENMWGNTGNQVIEYMAISHLFRTIKIGESIPWYQFVVTSNQDGIPVEIKAAEWQGR